MLGDDVLVAAAATLAGTVRHDDLVGRFGGEEFCVVLRDADRDTALAAALIAIADQNLYEAKNQGRNQVRGSVPGR